MGDLLETIFENFELVFLVVFGLGSAVASALKQKRAKEHAARQREAFRSAPSGVAEQPGAAAGGAVATKQGVPPGVETELDETYASLEEFFRQAEQVEAAPAPKPLKAKQRPSPPSKPAARPASSTLVEPEGFPSANLGGLPAFRAFDMPAFESEAFGVEFEEIESLPMSTSASGRITDADEQDELYRHEAWHPSTSWRDAVIAREVLDAPRAFRENQLPGYFWET